MKIILAGYNVDASLLANDERLTPETLSAAYARISRSAKSVDSLRSDSLREVAKARRSNQMIVFEMGHSSVAEHAVFNFDIIGVSRLLAEWVQRTRLASYTEKSQRYVTLHGDWVCPSEIRNTPLEDELASLVEQQNEMYHLLHQRALQFLMGSACGQTKKEKDGRAREDARYALSLATETQMGMTLNARSLQRLLRRLDRCPLDEAGELRDKLEAAAREVAPSLVRYTHADAYERCRSSEYAIVEGPAAPGVRLIEAPSNADDEILAAMLYEQGEGDWNNLATRVAAMSPQKKQAHFDRLFADMQAFHTMPRAYETAIFRFEMAVSSSCFAQLKRHRMATILIGGRSDEIVVPPLMQRLGMETEWSELRRDCASLAQQLDEEKPGLGDYARTNAHLLRMVLQANLRELHHLSRLRSDRHAQWEVRRVSKQIDTMVRAAAPLAARWIMGKHELESRRA